MSATGPLLGQAVHRFSGLRPQPCLRAEGQGGSYLRPLPNPDTLGWASGLPAAPRYLQEAEAWVPGPECPDGGPSHTRRGRLPTSSVSPPPAPQNWELGTRESPHGIPPYIQQGGAAGPRCSCYRGAPAACQLDSRVFSRQIRK